MSLMGVSGSSLTLMESYLKNRRKVVFVNGVASNQEESNIGVPQGSILGSLMFLIFLNDFSELPLLGDLYLFVDDTSLFYSGATACEIKRKMERDLVVIE